MKRKPVVVLALSLAVVPALVGCQMKGACTQPTAPEVSKIEASQKLLDVLPPAAKLAALRETEGCLITKVGRGEFEGHDLYTVDFETAKEQKGRVQTLSDGRVMSREVALGDVQAKTLPAAVQEGISVRTGHLKPESVVKATWGETPVYVVTVEVGGSKHVLTFDERGQLLKEQAQIDEEQLPVLVSAKLQDRFPDLRVNSVSEIRIATQTFFEIAGKTEKDRLTATMTPEGTFKSIKTEAR